jgi:hypothetical protein
MKTHSSLTFDCRFKQGSWILKINPTGSVMEQSQILKWDALQMFYHQLTENIKRHTIRSNLQPF